MEVNDNLTQKGKRDLEDVKRAIAGDQMAFATLMDRYRETIYFMMLKIVKSPEDAEDLTIEAFGKAFNRLKQYSPKYAFSTWLFRIASNNAIDFIRRKRVQMTSMDTGLTDEDGQAIRYDVEDSERDPEMKAIHRQKVEHMRSVVKELKPRYRELIEKRYFQELSYDEIATEMGLPLGTVKAQLFRAREFLAQMMESTRGAI